MSDLESYSLLGANLTPPVKVKLSICLATYNRGRFIGETLDSILAQLSPEVELLVVDGASPDNTEEVMLQYLTRCPAIRYFRESENSGIDRDYDKAVGYASGEYCWLMTDDDLLKPGAVDRVLEAVSEPVDLVVVNSEVRTADFSSVLSAGILPSEGAVKYGAEDSDRFFAEITGYLSFIGGVVIKRSIWLERSRSEYYGTLFVHVGVIFQKMVKSATVIREPLIVIRYGNAMWTPRGFEIWMFKWPYLVWSFDAFSKEAKSFVTPKEPWRNLKALFKYRAKGSYTITEFLNFLKNKPISRPTQLAAYLIACVPVGLANLIMVLRCRLLGSSEDMFLVDLMNCEKVTWLARKLYGGKSWN